MMRLTACRKADAALCKGHFLQKPQQPQVKDAPSLFSGHFPRLASGKGRSPHKEKETDMQNAWDTREDWWRLLDPSFPESSGGLAAKSAGRSADMRWRRISAEVWRRQEGAVLIRQRSQTRVLQCWLWSRWCSVHSRPLWHAALFLSRLSACSGYRLSRTMEQEVTQREEGILWRRRSPWWWSWPGWCRTWWRRAAGGRGGEWTAAS